MRPTCVLVAAFGLLGVVVLPMRAQEAIDAEFAYTGDRGPGFWKDINENCATTPTSRQSPIDISKVEEDGKLQPLNLMLPEVDVTLHDTGYTITADASAGDALDIDHMTYSMLGFHFHTLSEHTVEGRRGVMELHVVFENSKHEYAVVGMLYRIGRRNPFLERLITAGLPQQTRSKPVVLQRLDVGSALTNTSQYYRYDGSLTTPGCAPTVTWLVLKDWAELSAEQFEGFRTILGNDFRPLQQRNGRKILATRRSRGEGDDAAKSPGQLTEPQ